MLMISVNVEQSTQYFELRTDPVKPRLTNKSSEKHCASKARAMRKEPENDSEERRYGITREWNEWNRNRNKQNVEKAAVVWAD